MWQEVPQGSAEAVPPTNGTEHTWQETAAAQGTPAEGEVLGQGRECGPSWGTLGEFSCEEQPLALVLEVVSAV